MSRRKNTPQNHVEGRLTERSLLLLRLMDTFLFNIANFSGMTFVNPSTSTCNPSSLRLFHQLHLSSSLYIPQPVHRLTSLHLSSWQYPHRSSLPHPATYPTHIPPSFILATFHISPSRSPSYIYYTHLSHLHHSTCLSGYILPSAFLYIPLNLSSELHPSICPPSYIPLPGLTVLLAVSFHLSS